MAAKRPHDLDLDELESLHSLLCHPLMDVLLDQLCGAGAGGPVSVTMTNLADYKGENLREIGELQGRIKAYREIHNVAIQLKRAVFGEISTKKEARDAGSK